MAQLTTTLAILNKIRDGASQEYQNRIPVATQTNLSKMGDMITALETTKDEFTKAIVEKIALTKIHSKSYKNPLGFMKKGMLPYGKTIEQVFVSMAKAKSNFKNGNNPDGSPEPTGGADEIFSKENPDVKTEYHHKNRRDYYKVTISDDQVRRAFLNKDPINELMSAIMQSVWNAIEYDEYCLVKELIAKNSGHYHIVEVEEIADNANNAKACKDFVKSVKKISKSIAKMSDKYNGANVRTFTPIEDQVLLINGDVSVEVDVELLATAFNKGKVQIDIPIIELDDFGSLTDTYAILVDKEFIQIYDELQKVKTQENALSLYTNYFIHIWQLYACCKFVNAVQFKKKVVAP